ncbi:MAG: hypothetical protein ABIR30_03260 [Chitinophagaceae bacterium]
MKKKLATTLILITVILTLSSSLCSKISPARNLEGNWTTPFAPTLYYYSDACGNYSRVAKAQIGMRWEINGTNDASVVNIDIFRTSTSAVQLLVSPGCALYVPMTTLLTVRGDISSSQLTLSSGGVIVGSFSFTTNNLTGSFNSNFDKFCGVYCSGIGSDPLAITLTR